MWHYLGCHTPPYPSWVRKAREGLNAICDFLGTFNIPPPDLAFYPDSSAVTIWGNGWTGLLPWRTVWQGGPQTQTSPSVSPRCPPYCMNPNKLLSLSGSHFCHLPKKANTHPSAGGVDGMEAE